MHLVRWLMASPLKGASKLYLGGDNTWGQLGDNTVLTRSSPVLVSTNYWKSFAEGTSHTVAIRSDGALFGWGNNDYGQVGNGLFFNNISSPVQIGTSSWISVAASDVNSYAIRADGALFAWGDNTFGQIGNNSTVASTTNYSWTQISSNFYYKGFLRSDNKGFISDPFLLKNSNYFTNTSLSNTLSAAAAPCYTNNNFSKIYLGDTADINLAQYYPNLYNNFNIGTFQSSFAGILTDGALVVQGSNRFGELGIGNTDFTPFLTQVGTSSWTQVCIEGGVAAGIRSDGALFTWGSNINGLLGQNLFPGNDLYTSPVQVGTSSWTQVSISKYSTSQQAAMTIGAIRSDGALFTWGLREVGSLNALGNNNATQTVNISFTMLRAATLLDSTGTGYLLETGGTNYGVAGGDGVGINLQNYATSLPRHGLFQKFKGSWTQVDTNYAIKPDGTLWHWAATIPGDFDIPQVPTIDINAYLNSPIQIGTSSWSFVGTFPAGTSLSPQNFVGAIRADGALFTWGYNLTGAIGNNSTDYAYSPVQIGTSSWSQVDFTGRFTLAIRSDGALFAWGENNLGQLGDGTTINKSSPVQIGTSSWLQVGACNQPAAPGSIAIRSDGALFTWGGNVLGQIGDGTTINKSSPVQIGTSSWSFVGKTTTGPIRIAIRTDGALFTWGNNSQGQLGDGTTVPRSSPVQIGTSSWTQVQSTVINNLAAATHLTLGIRTDGALFVWGANSGLAAGGWLIGDYTGQPASSPVQIGVNSNRIFSPLQIGTSSWTQVSMGLYIALAIRSDGALFTWGNNSAGALGDGTTITRSSPVQIGTSSWTQVSVGHGHSTAIRIDGRLFAWGNNISGSNGGLGDGTTISRSSPVQIGTSSWSIVQAGYDTTYAIRSDGALFGWGNNFNAKLGDGTTISRSSPVLIGTSFTFVSSPVQIGTSSWSLVTAGKSYASAIRSDGALFAWGVNTNYNLGDGTTINRSSPVQIGTSSWTLVNAGTNFTLGIASNSALYGWGNNNNFATGVSDFVNPIMGAGFSHGAIVSRKGRLYTWGLNNFGQLGDGTTVNKSSPIQIGASSWSIVSGGLEHTLALNSAGQLYAWGRNTFGQLGDNTSINKSSPVQIGTSSWAQIKAGISHSVAVRIDGALFTWGSNSFGQLGYSDTLPLNISSPIQVGTSSWTFATTNRETAYAIRSDGSLFGWGKNDVGQIGNNSVNISGVMSWAQVAAGTSASVGIRSDGGLFTWGINFDGVLGDSTTISKSSPIQIGTSSWTQVAIWSGGENYAAAIRSDGALFTWGANNRGQLGSGTIVSRSSPVQVGTSSWTQITAGFGNAAAIRADGGLFTWGSSFFGEGGRGDQVSRSSPVQVGTSSWVQVTAAKGYAGLVQSQFAAIRADGALFTWGTNFYGTLGDPNIGYEDRSSPIQVGTSSWTQVSCGFGHALAVRSDGALFTWGRGAEGQLGTNSTVYGSEKIYSWTQVSLGYYGGNAIRNDGALFGWAYQNYDTIGTTSLANVNRIPVQVGTSSWSQISTTFFNTAAIRSDGALFTWGTNYSGQLGNNTTVGSYSPVQIGTSSWSQVSVGETTKAIRADGALFAWGNARSDAIIGDGTFNIDRSSPVLIGGTSSWTQVANGDSTNLAIRSDGALFAWGRASDGVTGDGTYGNTIGYDIYSWTQVKAGLNFAVALNSLGQLWAWGQNSLGQLGNGTTIITSSPVQIGTSSWTQIAAGHSAAAAIRSDGRLFVWGGNQFGVIGDVTTVNKSSPVAIGTSSWSQVSIGLDTIAGILSNGSVFVWGRNSAGQIGDNTVVNKSSPVLIGTSSWTQVTVGWDVGGPVDRVHAIRSDGALFAWGSNAYGTLGDNTTVSKSSPVQVGSSSWTLVRAANGYVGAIRSDGGLFTWGNNEFGQLGNGQTQTLSSPVQVGTSSWTQLTLGNGNFAIRSDGRLFAWGWYRYRTNYAIDMLGTGNTAYIDYRESWTAVAHGFSSNAGIRNDGALFSWGTGSGLIWNAERSPFTFQPSQTTKVGNSSWTQVVQGNQNFLALRTDGALFAWGDNTGGNLGDGTTVNRSSPVQIGTSSWVQITNTGNDFTLFSAAIRSDGALFAWGYNGEGELGDNTTVSKSSPVQIGTSSWTQVKVGFLQAIAIRSDGALFAWGYNGEGQIGDNTTVNKSSPVQIGTSSWTQVAVGSMAIRNDGALFAWGSNAGGQIGDNTTVNKSSPVQIGTSSWIFVASKGKPLFESASSNAYAIRSDGALFGWGQGAFGVDVGNVGDGTTISRSSPVQIGIGNSWSFVKRGGESVGPLAITTTGLVYIWGRTFVQASQGWQFTDVNLVSQSGPSNIADLPQGVAGGDRNWPYSPTAVQYYPFLRSPVQVGTDSWIQVSSHYNRDTGNAITYNGVFGIRNNNKMYAWGTNTTTAPLGTGNTIPRSSPVQIGFAQAILAPIQISTSSWTQVATINGAMLAIDSGSRLYTWGTANSTGQLGNNTITAEPTIQERGVYSWTQIATGGPGSINNSENVGARYAAIRSDGGLFVWGRGTSIPLGDNTTVSKSSPVQVGTSSWVQVSMGTYNSLAIRFGDYTVWGWGNFGFVGDNTTIARSSPVQIGSLRAEKVYCGPRVSHIIEKWTNTLWGWGTNNNGQIGDGTIVFRSSPVQIGTSRWSQITSNYFHTAAIREDGGLFTWGSTEFGQLADNSTVYRSSPVQVGTSSWTQVKSSPWATTLAIRKDGALFTWGSYTYGQGGTNADFFNGGAQNLSKSWSVVSANEGIASAGIQTDGSLYVWGLCNSGEGTPAGVPLGEFIYSPVQVGTSSWSQVATGYSGGVLVIRTDGALFAWGLNSSGQLGDNTTINKSSPVQIGTSSWTQVAFGSDTAYAIRSDGALFSWGGGSSGALGSNAITNRSSPVQVGTSSWTQVKGSAAPKAIAIRSDGSLFTWGSNVSGQLGDGTTINRSSPVQIGTSSWTQIAIDNTSSYAIRSDGALFSWGQNTFGQLGDNTAINRSSPVQIGTSSWTQVGPGMAIRSDGALFTFGYGISCGLNDNINRSSPVQVGTSSWSLIPTMNSTISYVFRAAIRSDRALFTWSGFDTYGKACPDIQQIANNLGTGGTFDPQTSSPVQVGLIASYNSPVQIGTSSWTQIAGTVFSSSAIRSDGALFAWGKNAFGNVGDNTTVNKSSPVQIGSDSWSQLGSAQNTFFAINKDSTVYAWAAGSDVLGLGTTVTTGRSSPVQLGYSGSWINIAVDYMGSSAAVRSDGALFTWGNNNTGQLGDNTTVNKSSPIQIGASSWTKVSAAGTTIAAIRNDGLLYVTGQNTTDGSFNPRSSPVLVGTEVNLSSPVQIGTSSWTQVAANNYQSAARRLDGSLFTWGLNSSGQLGDNTTINKSSPIQIGTSSWTQVQGPAGILSNSTLYVWGLGTSGQIGDNTAISKSSPVQLGSYPLAKSPIQIGTSSWTTISAGGTHAVAIRSNGSLFAWGSNITGFLRGGPIGDNTLINRSSPVQIGSSSWTAITAGNGVSYGITAAKLLFAWGDGQLGDGTTVNKSSPVQIGAGSWNDASSDENTVYATRSDGKLFAWGLNASGQIGELTTINRSSPVQVGTFFGVPTLVDSGSWSFVSAGFDNSIGIDSNKKAYIWGNDRTSAYTWTSLTWGAAIRSDGALFTWGGGANGVLGDGTTVNKSSPVQIGTSSWSQVVSGGYHMLAIRTDGALFAWGSNTYGELGDNTTVNKSSPVQIGTSSWSILPSPLGAYISHAIRIDGRLFGWGANQVAGPVGDSTLISRSSPVQIGTSSWTQVSHGINCAFAIRSDKALFSWGNNYYGQLGYGNSANSNSPIQIGTSSWTLVTGAGYGAYTTYAIRTDNALFGWGLSEYGQLGIGTLVNRSSPVQIGTDSWIQIATGVFAYAQGYGVYAINSSNKLFRWGSNFSGGYATPVQVPSLSSQSWTLLQSVIDLVPSRWLTLTRNDNKKFFIKADTYSYNTEYQSKNPVEFADIISYSSPTQIGVGGTWIKGSAGAGQNYLINNANVLYSWGSRLLSAGLIENDNSITPIVADIDSAVANKAFYGFRGYIEK